MRKKKKKKSPKLVMVKWIDAFHLDNGWMFGADPEFDNNPVFTTGFLMKETKDGLLISQTWFEEDCANVIGIPKGMVLNIIELGEIDLEKDYEFSRTSS